MAGARTEQASGGGEGENAGGDESGGGGGGSNQTTINSTELNLLKSKTKKMELEIKLLRRKLAKAGVESGEQQTVEDLIEEAKAEMVASGSGGAGGGTGASGEGDEKKASGDGEMVGDLMATSLDETMAKELSEFEVKEIDVLKYKHEQDIIAVKKEYSEQLDYVNNRVSLFV